MASSINDAGKIGKHLTNEAETAIAKLQRNDKDVRFCTFKLIDEGTIDVDVLPTATTASSATTARDQWSQFAAAFPYDACRYGLAVFPFTSQSDGVTREKTVFVQWSPVDACKVKDRMLSSIYAKVVEKYFQTIGGVVTARVEAGDVSDLDFDDVEAKIRIKTTVK